MSNVQKLPVSHSLNRFAEKKAFDAIVQTGRALPGHVIAVSGSIVTVNFDLQDEILPQVTMPLAGAEYIRWPIQPASETYSGDKGLAIPSDVYLGGISGLGGGVADGSQLANLSSLVWLPIGNQAWTLPTGVDANTLALYGKLSLLLLDSFSAHSSLKLSSSGITLTFGSGSISMTSSAVTITFGAHSIVISSTGITIDGKVFLSHIHTDPQGGNTGGVV